MNRRALRGTIEPGRAPEDTARDLPAAVDLQIDELVLHGFAPGDRLRIGDAVEAELARLVAERGVASWPQGELAIEHIDAGSFAVPSGAQARTVGERVARALYEAFPASASRPKLGQRPLQHRPANGQRDQIRSQSLQRNSSAIAGAEISGSGEAAQPADSGPSTPPVKKADCQYTITYTNPETCSCEDSKCAGKDVPSFKDYCGARLVYDITKVTGTGPDCPASLEGKYLTETVTSDHGCISSGAVRTGSAPIGSGGTVTKGQDDYYVCIPRTEAHKLPAKGCTEVLTQQLFVDGVLAETHKITFKINKTSSGCTGTATRS